MASATVSAANPLPHEHAGPKTWTMEELRTAPVSQLISPGGPPVCIDLKERFGRRYRVEYEESYFAEYGPNAHTHDPWYLTLPCQKGHIYPHGDNLLAVATNSRGPVVNQLQAIPGLRILQDGDDGINAVFLVDVFDQVARVMRPRRRRRLSPEQKAQAVARLRKHQFSPAAQGHENERARIAQPSPDTSPI